MTAAEKTSAGTPDELTAAHLQFCGAVCRTISHEMNNVTAILIELVGLTEDRLAAAAPLDPERTRSTLERMNRQLQRARDLMLLLNAFGHTVDEFTEKFAVGEVCRQAVALCRRFADLQRCSLEYQGSDADEREFSGSRFAVLHLLFRTLRSALAAAAPGSNLELRARTAEGGCLLEVTGAPRTDNPEQRLLERLLAASGGRPLDDRPGLWLGWQPVFPTGTEQANLEDSHGR